MMITHPLTDAAPYLEALYALDRMDQELADGFEVDFVASNLARVQQYGPRTRWRPKQLTVIKQLTDRYLPALAAELFHGQLRLEGL